MRTKKILLSFSILGFTTFGAIAMDADYVDGMSHELKHSAAMLSNMRRDNNEFVRANEASGHFDAFMNLQRPRVTVVSCVDSRVHTHAIDQTPDNDIFMARNLSGQFQASIPSILYGVNHSVAASISAEDSKGTPLLMFIGHDDCGAVATKTKLEWVKLHGTNGQADLEKLAHLEPEIVQELTNVHIARAAAIPSSASSAQEERFRRVVHENIKYNTHRQVDLAVQRFREQVAKGELIIVGALYDFQGREDQGRGRLIWIDARDASNTPGSGTIPAGALRYIDGRLLSESDPIPGDADSIHGPAFRVNKFVNEGVERLKQLENSMPHAGPKSVSKRKRE